MASSAVVEPRGVTRMSERDGAEPASRTYVEPGVTAAGAVHVNLTACPFTVACRFVGAPGAVGALTVTITSFDGGDTPHVLPTFRLFQFPPCTACCRRVPSSRQAGPRFPTTRTRLCRLLGCASLDHPKTGRRRTTLLHHHSWRRSWPAGSFSVSHSCRTLHS